MQQKSFVMSKVLHLNVLSPFQLYFFLIGMKRNVYSNVTELILFCE
jgi:hypothetical protein